MDVVISREANPMKEMECEINLCTQCKVIMRRFWEFGSKVGLLRYKSLNSSFGGNLLLACLDEEKVSFDCWWFGWMFLINQSDFGVYDLLNFEKQTKIFLQAFWRSPQITQAEPIWGFRQIRGVWFWITQKIHWRNLHQGSASSARAEKHHSPHF